MGCKRVYPLAISVQGVVTALMTGRPLASEKEVKGLQPSPPLPVTRCRPFDLHSEDEDYDEHRRERDDREKQKGSDGENQEEEAGLPPLMDDNWDDNGYPRFM